MQFHKISALIQARVEAMVASSRKLYVVDLNIDEIYEHYLNSFPAGTNNIFRVKREFECSSCRSFIRRFGNVVAIVNGKVETIWGVEIDDPIFKVVLAAMDEFVKNHKIKDVFITKEVSFGTPKSRETLDSGEVLTWEHLAIKVPSSIICTDKKSEEAVTGSLRDIRNVFKRGLDELKNEMFDALLEIHAQGTLYRGEEVAESLDAFRKIQISYNKLTSDLAKELFCWANFDRIPVHTAKIRGTAVGTILIDLSEGMDIDNALNKYERGVMAPENYKRPTPKFSPKMLAEAKKEAVELGIIDSFPRRHAVVSDVSINDVIFANKDVAKKISGDAFSGLEDQAVVNVKKFDRVEEIDALKFFTDVAPKASKIEVLVEARHERDFISLIAPVNPESPSLLKWPNGFSWAYNHNLADSSMKERVKSAGGSVDGVLRFSIQWNTKGDNNNDYDAHCTEPNNNHIYFRNKAHRHASSGILDVDVRMPFIEPAAQANKGVAVENITWSDINRMQEGVYTFSVDNYEHRGGRSGFTAELEFDGQIYSFAYNKDLPDGKQVIVATVEFSRKNGFKIVSSLDSSVSSNMIWGINTNQFHQVYMAMFSPNYWHEQPCIGHRHYIFVIKDCINNDSPNGFFNEFLREDLMKHKRVFEAMGGQMKVSPSPDQLSGVGFSSSKRNSIVCRVEGQTRRVLKVNF